MDKTIEQSMTGLETILKKQLDLHEQLLAMMDHKHEALRTGQARQLVEACQLENEKVQEISELEKHRLEIVARMTLYFHPEAAEPMRMSQLIDCLPEPASQRLTLMRSQLRHRMELVKEKASVSRRATESLMRHVHGLVHSIGVISTGVSTYASNGTRPHEAVAVSTFVTTA